MKGFTKRNNSKVSMPPKQQKSIGSGSLCAAFTSDGSKQQTKDILDYYKYAEGEFNKIVRDAKSGALHKSVRYDSDNFCGQRGRSHELKLIKGRKNLRLILFFTGASVGNPGAVFISTDDDNGVDRYFPCFDFALGDIKYKR